MPGLLFLLASPSANLSGLARVLANYLPDIAAERQCLADLGSMFLISFKILPEFLNSLETNISNNLKIKNVRTKCFRLKILYRWGFFYKKKQLNSEIYSF